MEAQIRLARRAGELWEQVRAERDPFLLAYRTGAVFQPQEGEPPGVDGDTVPGVFEFMLWDRPIRLSFPACTPVDSSTRAPLDTFNETMLAYYFATSDGMPITGEWIAFSDLPDGRFYTQAFQGYSGNVLARAFGEHLDRFTQAARRSGGWEIPFGSRGFGFKALPRVHVAAVAWEGDEDFPPSYQVLFDAASSHHLTTDALALLGSALVKRLVKAGVG